MPLAFAMLQTFQRFMNQVLQGLNFVYVYIDELFIASSSPEELKHLRNVFQCLEEHGIVINSGVPLSLLSRALKPAETRYSNIVLMIVSCWLFIWPSKNLDTF